MRKELIKRAYDANAFTAVSAEGTAVNPNIWDTRLREYQSENLVVAPLAEQFDLTGAGADLKVTIDEKPAAAAAALTEGSDVAVTAITTRNVTFTPTQYAARYQISQKEYVRAFFNTMENATKKIGYQLALAKDNLAITVIEAAAGTSIVPATAVTAGRAAGDLTSADTLGYDEIISGARVIKSNLYVPADLIVNFYQGADLLRLDSVNEANKFGSREALENGLIGDVFGVKIYETTQIGVTAGTVGDEANALMIGKTPTGEKAFGIAVKESPSISKDYNVVNLSHDIVGHEDYDIKSLHDDAMVIITTWSE